MPCDSTSPDPKHSKDPSNEVFLHRKMASLGITPLEHNVDRSYRRSSARRSASISKVSEMRRNGERFHVRLPSESRIRNLEPFRAQAGVQKSSKKNINVVQSIKQEQAQVATEQLKHFLMLNGTSFPEFSFDDNFDEAAVEKASQRVQSLTDELIKDQFLNRLKNIPSPESVDYGIALFLGIVQQGFERYYAMGLTHFLRICLHLEYTNSHYILPMDLISEALAKVLEQKHCTKEHIMSTWLMVRLIRKYKNVLKYLLDCNILKRLHNLLNSNDNSDFLDPGMRLVAEVLARDAGVALKEKVMFPIFNKFSLLPADTKTHFVLFLKMWVVFLKEESHFEQIRQHVGPDPELEVIRLLLSVQGLLINYKVYKNLFKESQFDELMDVIDTDPDTLCFVYNSLGVISAKAPEKIYDPLKLFVLIQKVHFNESVNVTLRMNGINAPVASLQIIIESIPDTEPHQPEIEALNKGKLPSKPKKLKNGDKVLGVLFPVLMHLSRCGVELGYPIYIAFTKLFRYARKVHKETFASIVKSHGVVPIVQSKIRTISPDSVILYSLVSCVRELVADKRLHDSVRGHSLNVFLRTAIMNHIESTPTMADNVSMMLMEIDAIDKVLAV